MGVRLTQYWRGARRGNRPVVPSRPVNTASSWEQSSLTISFSAWKDVPRVRQPSFLPATSPPFLPPADETYEREEAVSRLQNQHESVLEPAGGVQYATRGEYGGPGNSAVRRGGGDGVQAGAGGYTGAL